MSWPVLCAVWRREGIMFRRYWLATTFGALVEPLIYLAGFGLGFGLLVDRVDGHPYLDFIGTGTVVTSVLFASAFAGMFETFYRRTQQRIYEVMLTQPVRVSAVVGAEASWTAVKSAGFGCAPLVVSLFFGLAPRWEMLLVPVVGLVAGLGFALFGMWISVLVSAVDGLRLVTSGLLTPLVMVGGVFFPLTGMPSWLTVIAQFNPIQHCVQLVRHASFGVLGAADVGHALVLLAFAALLWPLSVRGLARRLAD
ncbi:ABC transporter permease [Amycolatopsis coloradensis]|uniref:ABC transporter permease n=1 Tax=Amycolatopsis coloradensis TaxID=76021 RepID=UPI000A04ECD1|nr:ABC transporter permease [Amycolatopsis coloradensis]